MIEGRYDYEACRKEVLCLRLITKEQAVAAFDKWLNPLCANNKPKKRRRMVVTPLVLAKMCHQWVGPPLRMEWCATQLATMRHKQPLLLV
mmetsp:Transcript_24487/g.41930  ORF Transcript_24487/g.41930 Transcript_24487/m.41930 type:complete len:90 (-) Transcript_24487:298-567(-)